MAFKLLPDMNWTIDEIESLPPLEREAYLAIAREFVEKKNQQRKLHG
ncbi:baseplate hub assembly catalyst [Agrobacterium phage OLIVR5]|uniref:Baseplate hub assembly catalyst n=3 Tax=Caudoviricetes TaxID=2731619 RepID=A0A858MSQ8_9CAUD|nr:baseplate hub assembly catalyst [Agrobacterium phage OLIVR5]QIW87807.1 baseplate hub assembly catalyst [Agrobacterium phage OLIVR5]QIW88072.1 baseplate hub assembly catalyst [Agrobacterium phage OLIVR6]